MSSALLREVAAFVGLVVMVGTVAVQVWFAMRAQGRTGGRTDEDALDLDDVQDHAARTAMRPAHRTPRARRQRNGDRHAANGRNMPQMARSMITRTHD